MRGKTVVGMVAVMALALVTRGVVLAWPDEPPTRATISGPGLVGEVEITDPQALAALKLGGLEDLDRGPVAEPAVSGPGYAITRYFYGGKFNFAHLRYYPGVSGQPGYVYWEDGPDLTGDHTPFDHTWLVATARGDSAMRNLLAQLGIARPGSSSSMPVQAAQASGATVMDPEQATTPAATSAPAWPEYLVILAALAFGGMLVAHAPKSEHN